MNAPYYYVPQNNSFADFSPSGMFGYGQQASMAQALTKQGQVKHRAQRFPRPEAGATGARMIDPTVSQAMNSPTNLSILESAHAKLLDFMKSNEQESLIMIPNSYERLLIHRVCRFYGIGSETPALGGNYEIRLSKAPGFNVTTCSDALVKAMLESREAHERAAQEDASNTGPSSTPPLAPLTSGASTPLSSGRTEGAPYGGAFLNGSGMGGGGGGGGRFGAAAATLSAGQVQGNPYPMMMVPMYPPYNYMMQPSAPYTASMTPMPRSLSPGSLPHVPLPLGHVRFGAGMTHVSEPLIGQSPGGHMFGGGGSGSMGSRQNGLVSHLHSQGGAAAAAAGAGAYFSGRGVHMNLNGRRE